ncbi:MAG: efflux RND transporter periplasmic adaptor subunit [Alphaproteobacteria bacterium]|nr:efflux RND transporter periplasmic adaptor subunit [Alphaproteobacteria bacterium]
MVQKAAFFQSVVLGLALLVAACSGGEADETTTATEGPLVEVVEVAPASAAGSVRASGMIGYRREPVLAFTAAGVVGAIDVDSGDVVRRGQRLATLRRTGAGANVDEAALARANAERDLARTQELFERGFVSEARLESARLAVERARDSSVLTAPADGVILRRGVDPSQTVTAGTPVFVFGETASGIVVRAPVASDDAARIRVGDTAQIRVNGAQRPGRVTRVGAQGDAATGAFEVEIEITAPEGLRSGMVAEVEVAATPGANPQTSIIVPTLALLDARADQGVVYVLDANAVARRRAVRTAGVTSAGVIVVEGLNPGDRIVAAGAAYVRDGESVRIAPGA